MGETTRDFQTNVMGAKPLSAMFDPRKEPPLSFQEACQLPWLRSRRQGKRLNVCTIWRWAKMGRNGVKLETFLQGGARFTSEQAIARFIAASNGGRMPDQDAATNRNTAIKAAEHRLAAARI